jgi:hypothetical protein
MSVSDRQRQQSRENAKRNRRVVNAIKEAVGCSKCGESRLECLDFHHNTPLNRRTSGMTRSQIKRHEVSSLVTQGRSLGKLFRLLALCTILCANCHRIETFRAMKRASKQVSTQRALGIPVGAKGGGHGDHVTLLQ